MIWLQCRYLAILFLSTFAFLRRAFFHTKMESYNRRINYMKWGSKTIMMTKLLGKTHESKSWTFYGNTITFAFYSNTLIECIKCREKKCLSAKEGKTLKNFYNLRFLVDNFIGSLIYCSCLKMMKKFKNKMKYEKFRQFQSLRSSQPNDTKTNRSIRIHGIKLLQVIPMFPAIICLDFIFQRIFHLMWIIINSSFADACYLPPRRRLFVQSEIIDSKSMYLKHSGEHCKSRSLKKIKSQWQSVPKKIKVG